MALRLSALFVCPASPGHTNATKIVEIAHVMTTAKSYTFEDLELGLEASFSRAVTDADIVTFSDVTGDRNPMHLDAVYAATTPFKTPISHGMPTAGYISAVFGTRLPGPGAIYVSQTLNFRAPVRHGDEVTAHVRIIDLVPAKRRARFACVCKVGETVVLEGEAILMVPGRK